MKRKKLLAIGLSAVIFSSVFEPFALAQSFDSGQESKKSTKEGLQSEGEKPSLDELVRRGWEASSRSDLQALDQLVQTALQFYGQEAQAQEAALTDFPPRGKEKEYEALNKVALIMFIRAEAYMNQGRKEEAIRYFQEIMDRFPHAQAWDPRGWYWSVADKSRISIDVMLGRVQEEEEPELKLRTKPVLERPGTEEIVDYTRYGIFHNVGTDQYYYEITDPVGLAKAVGEGIYPNTGSWVRKNPRYKKALKEGRLEGSHWDFVQTTDLEAAFFKWTQAAEPWGVKLFYIGFIFEKAGMYTQALKAYHALIVHFPKTVAWTYWHTPWYPAQAAVAKIKYILRMHPESDRKARWMKVEVINGFDNDITNDRIITWPGRLVKRTWLDKLKKFFNLEKRYEDPGRIVAQRGKGRVRLIRYENGHWRLLVDGKPYFIRGMNYSPTAVGKSPDKGTMEHWTVQDTDGNGIPDAPFESWVDKNKNNRQDPDEPVVGDFALMKALGVNTIREYHHPHHINKDVLRRMYDEAGIMVAMGDFLGKYTLGSGASWFEGTDYENPEHRKNMMESVRRMVMEYKDEPYLLMWILGNENNYGVACNADKKPVVYYRFANEVAKMIKSLDPDHPVALVNGDTLYLDIFAKEAPDIDIFAANVYRGDYGFGAYWEQVRQATDRPTFISEFGAPAYAKHLTLEEAEEAQAAYHRGNWYDIAANGAGRIDGQGNSLGGFVFEWMDEWWKNYEPYRHDRQSDAVGPFPGGYYYEEWFGLIAQGDGQNSPFLRQLRKAYHAYEEMWQDQRAGGCMSSLPKRP